MVTGLRPVGNGWTVSDHSPHLRVREGPESWRCTNRHKRPRVARRVAEIHRSDVAEVFTDGDRLYTVNAVPGVAVYGERLVRQGDVEYRDWNPRRSKLAAFLKKGAAVFPFGRTTDVLYLGAAQGTTVSHLADICREGTIYSVEISRRAFQKLLDVSERRTNVMPILGDARTPAAYARLLGGVGAVYQDVAQRDQVGIFLANLEYLRPGGFGLLCLKARSVDVAASPRSIYAETRRRLAKAVTVVQVADLEPYEGDHAAFLVEKT